MNAARDLDQIGLDNADIGMTGVKALRKLLFSTPLDTFPVVAPLLFCAESLTERGTCLRVIPR